MIHNITPSDPVEEPILYLYNGSEYITPKLLKKFTKKNGIKVIYSTSHTNETLHTKLTHYPKETYDLIIPNAREIFPTKVKAEPNKTYFLSIPSSQFISEMVKKGVLQKIDKSKLSNFNEPDPKLLEDVFAPESDYSIPFLLIYDEAVVNSNELDDSNARWESLAIPVGSRHVNNAMQLIDFILHPDIALDCTAKKPLTIRAAGSVSQ